MNFINWRESFEFKYKISEFKCTILSVYLYLGGIWYIQYPKRVRQWRDKKVEQVVRH